jgi:hypothetical protein
MVRISAITLDTLLKLVRGQVIQKLGEDGLSGVHPSFLTIGAASGHPALAPVLPPSISNRKMRVIFYPLQYVLVTERGPILAGHYCADVLASMVLYSAFTLISSLRAIRIQPLVALRAD